MTLPSRLIFSIPYIIYYKVYKKEEDYKIIAMIQSNPAAAQALAEGKVVLSYVTEDFSNIQPGSVLDISCYQVEGNVFGECSDVYIKRPLYERSIRTYTISNGFSGTLGEVFKLHYRAFRAK